MIGFSRKAVGAFLLFSISACVSAESPRRDRIVEEGFALILLENGDVIQVELAESPEKRTRGYMFRERVGPEEGMLFRFPVASFQSIWMKNCLVPLDIIWVREDGRVVQLEENAPPCESARPCLPYTPMQKTRYVLELAGGQARRRGIAVGSVMQMVFGPDENGSH
ncbi:MAG: DUF192 domain-containing protein [Acidobacteriota bacterium]